MSGWWNSTRGYLLIDTGMAGRTSFDALTASLDQSVSPGREIATVVATHIHPDHIGAAPDRCSASGAKLLIHRAEFDYLNADLARARLHWMQAAFTEGGVPR